MEPNFPPQTSRTPPDRRLPRAAALTLGGLILAGVGFMSAYGLAGARYAPSEKPTAQTAATVEAATSSNPFASISLIAKSTYVLDMKTGKTLYAHNPDAQLPLASLTKIALVLSVIQALPPQTLISTPAHYALPPAGGTERLPADTTWNLGDATGFILAASSDDGANLLAQVANNAIHSEYPQSPAQGATLWRMNELAQQLGLRNTYFLNDSGLDESTTQSGAYGSARDIAALFSYAASSSPATFAATTQPRVTIRATDGTEVIGTNTDTALNSIPGIIMGKTGYTDLAGGNLAIVFNAAPDHPIVAVVLGSTLDGRFSDMQQLIPAIQEAVAEGQ